MAGPYTFKLDDDAGTWTCENGNGTQVDSGDLPLTDHKRLDAIFSDFGVSDPTASAMLDFIKSNWTETEV